MSGIVVFYIDNDDAESREHISISNGVCIFLWIGGFYGLWTLVFQMGLYLFIDCVKHCDFISCTNWSFLVSWQFPK